MNNRIREMCTAKNIPIMQIVRHTKLTKSYVHNIVNGKTVPSIRNARKIAKSLESTVDEVFPIELEEAN